MFPTLSPRDRFGHEAVVSSLATSVVATPTPGATAEVTENNPQSADISRVG
jgi:hypothetical protein